MSNLTDQAVTAIVDLIRAELDNGKPGRFNRIVKLADGARKLSEMYQGALDLDDDDADAANAVFGPRMMMQNGAGTGDMIRELMMAAGPLLANAGKEMQARVAAGRAAELRDLLAAARGKRIIPELEGRIRALLAELAGSMEEPAMPRLRLPPAEEGEEA